MGIRDFGYLSFFLLSVLHAQSEGVKSQSEAVKAYLNTQLLEQKQFKLSGLLEKVSATKERSYAECDFTFDGVSTKIKYLPYSSKEPSYNVALVKGNLSAKDSSGRVVLSYTGSETHLFSFLERAFKEIRNEEKGYDSLFDVMFWKMSTRKGVTVIEAFSQGLFPIQLLRLEFDELNHLHAVMVELESGEAYALWAKQ
ncbi:MAG: hypothetical protein R3A80_09310 [Bdellovibrionota bacterium]